MSGKNRKVMRSGELFGNPLVQALRPLYGILPEQVKELVRLGVEIAGSPGDSRRKINLHKMYKCAGNSEEADFTPPFFIATISDQCNLRCPNCLYVLANPDKFFTGYIEVADFRKILQKYNREKKAEVIYLTGGEPLMHPDFDGIVDVALEYDVKVRISTNGILVPRKIESLSRMEMVNISMDSYNPETFKKYRGGTEKQFKSIIEGVRLLKENSQWFSISFVLSRENIGEARKMLDFARGIAPDRVNLHSVNPHGTDEFHPLTAGSPDVQKFIEETTAGSDYPFDLDLPVIFDPDSSEFREKKCLQPWSYFCFNSKGDVAYCCQIEHDEAIGNVFGDYDLNSGKMKAFRSTMIEKKFTGHCRFCHRRFSGSEPATFDAKAGKWSFPGKK